MKLDLRMSPLDMSYMYKNSETIEVYDTDIFIDKTACTPRRSSLHVFSLR